MRQLKYIFGIFLLVASQAIFAASNATPFGVEVGVASLTDVKQQIGSKTELQSIGINKYTGGKMFESDGEAMEIDGIHKITLIFDNADVLSGVLVTMDKDPKNLAKSFTGKYKLVSNKIDNFMNYGYAKFQKGDSVIEINAPHLSFEMEVRYLSNKLVSAFNQQSNAEQNSKQKRKADNL